MMTNPDYMLQATKDRQARIAADVQALRNPQPAIEPGTIRRAVGNALIHLGERVGGHPESRDPVWTTPPHTTIHLV